MIIGRDYIGTSAGAVILNVQGKIFLAQRGVEARDDVGKWEFPGGCLRLFESREAAVKRIIREKHDLEINLDGLLGVYDVIDQTAGDHWLSTTYLSTCKDANAKIFFPAKCQTIGWFDLPEIEQLPLSRITALNLYDLNQRLKLIPRL